MPSYSERYDTLSWCSTLSDHISNQMSKPVSQSIPRWLSAELCAKPQGSADGEADDGDVSRHCFRNGLS